MRIFKIGICLLCLAFFGLATSTFAGNKKIVLVAGKPSHGPGEHEFNAGVLLLKGCLDTFPGLDVIAYTNGWPTNAKAFTGADAVVLYLDGGDNHPAIQSNRLAQLQDVMKDGAGLACIHYAVEVPAKKGGYEFLNWIGGYFEAFWSVNPTWVADFKELPKHPITRGVKPFAIKDEWYYHMRFQDEHVIPLLTAIPPDETHEHKDDAHGGNEFVRARKGMPEDVAWAYERPDGGRGFGLTGAHYHTNWGNADFRKLVLNGILWIAKVEVPENGVQSTVTPEELTKNLDPKGAKKKAQASVPAKAKYKSGILQGGLVTVNADISGAKKLYLVVTDGGNGFGCDWADWLEPQLVRADGSMTKLTELKWKSAMAGWNQATVGKSVGGGLLKIDKKVFEEGIGTHAPSLIEYDLPDGFVKFTAKAGLDDGGTEQHCGAQVEFMIFTEKPPESLLQTSSLTPGQSHAFGPEAAQQALNSFTVAPGLEISLFASEPMVRNPTDMDIDERGRVWVTEGVNYRSSFQSWGILQPAGDKIVILEDTKGTGRADKETVFYQGPEINSALGICVLGNKVILSRSPDVFVLTDTDGDGKADKKEILFTGIGGVDHDHGVHAFTFGPDGKLYFNFGNAGENLKDRNGKQIIDPDGNPISNTGNPYRQGMVLRCNVDGSEVEVLAHNFRNPYEVAVDSFGTLWQSDNDDDGNRGTRINYVMEHGNYGFTDELTGAGWFEKRTNLEREIPARHWHQNDPGVVPNMLVTGAGAPTGAMIYEGTLLPEMFRGKMILADAGMRTVRAYSTKASGAGYSAEGTDILTSSESWFRPSDVCTAPDGSLMVADWNDAVVGGHDMADRDPAKMTGRIYRLTPSGAKLSVPKLDLKTAEGCVAALESPNLSTRYLGWTALHEMQRGAEKALLKVWNENADARMRARALQLLARIKGSENKYVKLALKDKNPDLRITGLRIAREEKMDVIPFVKMLVNDASAQVRRECAITLRHNTSPQAAKLWAALARQHDGKDRWYLEALGIGADKQEDKFFAGWLTQVGTNWNTPAGKDIVWRSRALQSAELLSQVIMDKQMPEAERARYLRAFDFIKGPDKNAALVQLLTMATKD